VSENVSEFLSRAEDKYSISNAKSSMRAAVPDASEINKGSVV
jgi:hypothetical protein